MRASIAGAQGGVCQPPPPKPLTAGRAHCIKSGPVTPRTSAAGSSATSSSHAMKKICALIFVVAASLQSFGSQAAAGEWIKFTSEAGRFSVLVAGPGGPKGEAGAQTHPTHRADTPHHL